MHFTIKSVVRSECKTADDFFCVVLLPYFRQREEREQLVMKRRLERQQKEIDQKQEMMQKLEETAKASSRAMEEKVREEREKQKLRQESCVVL